MGGLSPAGSSVLPGQDGGKEPLERKGWVGSGHRLGPAGKVPSSLPPQHLDKRACSHSLSERLSSLPAMTTHTQGLSQPETSIWNKAPRNET